MILVKPEQRAGKQEGAHFIALVIVNQGAPILMFSLARVCMLVKVRAVEERESVPILGEMGWNPIQYYPQPRLVSFVHEISEVVGGTVARGWRKVSDGLIPPGSVVGMLGDGQELEMGVAHVPGVRHQLVGQLAIA